MEASLTPIGVSCIIPAAGPAGLYALGLNPDSHSMMASIIGFISYCSHKA
jgi:hypothetical protein